MHRLISIFIIAPLLQGCSSDESLTAYGGAGQIWTLTELNQQSFGATATLNLTTPGEITGQAPCNSYRAGQTAPYPWFEAEALITTRKTCPEHLAETRYLSALQAMTQAEIAGDVLILRDDADQELVFIR